PITLCVVGILPAIVLSHLARANLYDARTDGIEFAKSIAYYLLFVGVVNAPWKLRTFLLCFVFFALAATLLAILHYHEIIEIEALKVIEQRDIDPNTGELTILPRMRSTGIFNDPNDLCLILVMAIALCVHNFAEHRSGLARVAWLALLATFAYALLL